MAGYATGAGIVSTVGMAHGAARGAANLGRGVAAAATNRSMPGDLPGPRTAAFYSNRYGTSLGAMHGTTTQQGIMEQQRGIAAGIASRVEAGPPPASFHNNDPQAVFPRNPHVISGSDRVPTGNPVAARQVVRRAAAKARAPQWGRGEPADFNAGQMGPPRPPKGGGKGRPPPWARQPLRVD